MKEKSASVAPRKLLLSTAVHVQGGSPGIPGFFSQACEGMFLAINQEKEVAGWLCSFERHCNILIISFSTSTYPRYLRDRNLLLMNEQAKQWYNEVIMCKVQSTIKIRHTRSRKCIQNENLWSWCKGEHSVTFSGKAWTNIYFLLMEDWSQAKV